MPKSRVFDYLIVFSLFFVTGFYWPNHPIVQMKYLCWEMFITFLTAVYFIIGPERKINDWLPGIFIIYCTLNMFSHLIGGNTKFAMMTVFFVVLGYYLIANGLSHYGVQLIKKGLVIYAILNCGSYFLESMDIDSPFTLVGPALRASGFMVYPAHFAVLCAVALFFAWEWKKWLCIPIIPALICVNEYSVFLGLGLCFIWHFRKKWWLWVALAVLVAVVAVVGHRWFIDQVGGRWHLRWQFLEPAWKVAWGRAIDGWGVGSYSGLANQIFPQFPKNSWLELHNELIQGFFEGGLILVGIIVLWFWTLGKKIVGAYYEPPFIFSFIIFFTVSCAHSIFHFPDVCWIFVILLACFQIEYYEADKKWDLNDKSN